MRARAGLWLALFAGTGCTYGVHLEPGPDALALPERANAAAAKADGVRVVVEGKAWHGQPGDLTSVVTPVRITIENHSGGPLAIQFRHFALASASGFSAHAIPPLSIQRPGYVVAAPAFPYGGFYISPPYAPYYPGLTPWWGPFDFDPFFYDGYYTYWQAPLPSPDMMEKALPEGVLDDNGWVAGFLYFQRASPAMGQVTFTGEFVNANTKAKVGAIAIPFLVKKG